MAKRHEPELTLSDSAAERTTQGAELFPPDLVPLLRAALPTHPALLNVSDSVLANLLTLIFFASLEAEETERHPLRVAFVGSDSPARYSVERGPSSSAIYQWSLLPFRQPRLCDTEALLKLSRAASSEHVFSKVVAMKEGQLCVVGLAREGLRLEDDPFLKIIAPTPGSLEIWSGRRRIMRYVRGQIQAAPENVLLSAGPVRRALDMAADAAGVSRVARPGYLDAVAGLVREMAVHPYGGILVLSAADDPELPTESGFRTNANSSPSALLEQLAELDELSEATRREPKPALLRSALRVEIDRTVAEIGRLTALDGATVLSCTLAVKGFGLILPVLAEVCVMDAGDAEATMLRPLSIHAHGARHRAAASYARLHPGSVVFIATEDRDLGCMLQELGSPHVLVWRFRPSDIRFE